MIPSFWQILIILLVILILFGAGKLPNAMYDLGKGLRNFRRGLTLDEKKDIDKSKNEKNLEDKQS